MVEDGVEGFVGEVEEVGVGGWCGRYASVVVVGCVSTSTRGVITSITAVGAVAITTPSRTTTKSSTDSRDVIRTKTWSITSQR